MSSISKRPLSAIIPFAALVAIAWAAPSIAQPPDRSRPELAQELSSVRHGIAVREGLAQQAQSLRNETISEQSRLATLSAEWPRQLSQLRTDLADYVRQQEQATEAQHTDEVRRISEERGRLDRLWGRHQQTHRDLVQRPSPAVPLEQQLAALNRERRTLEAERDRVLEDLRTGMFCSKCGKSRYELENDGNSETFEQHLSNVGGQPVMDEAAIERREDEYASRIAALGARIGALYRRVSEARERHTQDLRRSQQEFNQAQVDYHQGIRSLDTRSAAADEAKRSALATLAQERTTREREIRARDEATHAELLALREAIQQNTAYVDEQLARIGTEMQDFRAREAALLAQLGNVDPEEPSSVQRQALMMQRMAASDPSLSRADFLGDQDYREYLESMRRFELMKASRTESNRGERATRELLEATRWVAAQMGIDLQDPVREDVQAWIRARFIEKRRVELGLPADTRPCYDLPRDNVCYQRAQR